MPGNSNAYFTSTIDTSAVSADSDTVVATIPNVVVSEYQRNLTVIGWVSWELDDSPAGCYYAFAYDIENGGAEFAESPLVTYDATIVGTALVANLQLEPGIHDISIVFHNADAVANATVLYLSLLTLVGD